MDGELTTKVLEIDAKINKKTGRFAIIEQLLADGIDHMFGNPGTVEQGFVDALSDYPDFKYIFALWQLEVIMVSGYLLSNPDG
ncbi:MAG: hypothetical protein RLZZ535_702 [Cyanobacteriota bacterium]